MRNFFNSIKNGLSRVWQAIKRFFAKIFTRPETTGLPMSERLRPTFKYIGSLIVIGAILLGAILLIRGNNKDDGTSPDIAQVYAPSIGTALPPDEPGKNGAASGEVAPSPTPTITRVAPKTGVDDNEPVAYKNFEQHFAATLPPHTEVLEKTNSVTFSSTSSWYLTINTSMQGAETLASIQAQLINSQDVKNLNTTQFQNVDALQFSLPKLDGYGLVFIKNNTIFYLLGDKKLFNTFQTI